MESSAARSRTPTAGVAIARAKQLLLERARDEFVETRHAMLFPRAAGFTGLEERQVSALFPRAVLAGVLLDVADWDEAADPFPAACRRLARREAEHAARAKLTDRQGGWSYFPGLPELPPDVDSLAAVSNLFARIAPDLMPLCEGPLRLALESWRGDGLPETWIVGPTEEPALRERMLWGISHCWGRGPDIDVCANLFLTLAGCDDPARREAARRGAALLASLQGADGSWDATWYAGRQYCASLCVRLLAMMGNASAVARALRFVAASQRDDGGWGDAFPVPLDTALALWTLVRAGVGECREPIERGVERLLRWQDDDGSWRASPWIKMDIGRATGRVVMTATYSSETLTTAFCLRALVAARRALDHAGEVGGSRARSLS